MDNKNEALESDFQTDLLKMQRDELLKFLENLSEPVWESELLRIAFPKADLVSGNAWQMYRWHFLLFHELYRMADEFYQAGKYLHIHFMRTSLVEFPEKEFCRHFDAETGRFCNARVSEKADYCDFHFQKIDQTAIDSLSERYFYLDWRNYQALSAEDAEKFVGGAWQLLQNYEDYKECLAVMGLPEGSSMDTLKKRFRFLARTMHPDLRPDVCHEEFARINSAYRKLLAYMGCR